jgi:alkanesulfonate monooxygenase SsuD/methylene tetrahydromethanopterin reductase-like flavin-dependent oxidoreductase (luciferase family)
LQKIEWIREAAGKRFDRIVLSMLVQVVAMTNDREAEAERIAAEFKVPPIALRASPLILIGSVEEIADTLLQRRERLGISYITVFEKDLDSLARVIERIRSVGIGSG